MATAAPLPGFAGIEHIGLTVPDLEQATRFFASLLGCETLYDVGPFETPDDWMASHLAAHPRARINKIRVLRCGNGPVLELFEFASPDQSTDVPKHSDHAGWHVALYVEDMDRALAALKAHDVSIQSGPVEMTQGPSTGMTWLYFKTPWGQQMELVSYPGGLAAYKGLREVWRPRT
jgi:catechol 2,3-dioxygenase-like lactoylglutathione lyase family enzyme